MTRLFIVTLFNLHAEHIMRNVRLSELHAGIKIARRNFNNPRYADDTTLMAEREEDSKSLLMVTKSGKAGLKLSIKKKNHLRSWHLVPLLHGITFLLLGRKAMTNLDSGLKSQDITLLTKVCTVKAMVFSVAMYGCESWTIKKAEG